MDRQGRRRAVPTVLTLRCLYPNRTPLSSSNNDRSWAIPCCTALAAPWVAFSRDQLDPDPGSECEACLPAASARLVGELYEVTS